MLRTAGQTLRSLRANRNALFFLLFAGVTTTGLWACSLATTRPVQLMSETAAAMKAAKEVNADTVTPELFQRANEAYFRAQNEYRMKNFNIARDYAEKAKRLAEEAEFESLRRGVARTSMTPGDETSSGSSSAEPYQYPTPTGTPAFIMEEQGTTGAQNNPASPNSTNPSSSSPNPRPTPLGTPMFAPPPL